MVLEESTRFGASAASKCNGNGGAFLHMMSSSAPSLSSSSSTGFFRMSFSGSHVTNNKCLTILPLMVTAILACMGGIYVAQAQPQCVENNSVPLIWKKALLNNKFNNWPFPWRSVESVITSSTNSEKKDFIDWHPCHDQILGDNEDILMFLWVRFQDNHYALMDKLKTKNLSISSASRNLMDLYDPSSTQNMSFLSGAIERKDSNGPFDIPIIRLVGLVPLKYSDDAQVLLHKYVDIKSGLIKATGIYGEEIAEMEDLLEYRKSHSESAFKILK